MLRWNKLGLLFKPAEVKDRPWLKEFAQGPCVLKFDDFIRVYFSCRPLPDENKQYVSYTGYVDLDRKDIFKIKNVSQQPILDLGKKGTFDEFGVYPTSVIKEGSEVVAYYGGWTRCESVPFNVAIGRAVSKDGGKTFIRSGEGPIISYSADEPFVMSGPKIRKFNGKYHLYYIAGRKWIMHEGRAEPVYKIRLATSDDGINWVKLNKDLIQSRIEPDECQASPDVIFSNGRYHMFFCYRYSTDYRGKEKGYRIGYAQSENGIDWLRQDEKVGIDISQEGWDSEMVSYPHVFELDGNIYMFYLGNGVGREGFGVAKLEGIL
jgi:predicted GH43/DUF377 family glycosyl hydrolase